MGKILYPHVRFPCSTMRTIFTERASGHLVASYIGHQILLARQYTSRCIAEIMKVQNYLGLGQAYQGMHMHSYTIFLALDQMCGTACMTGAGLQTQSRATKLNNY
jgi:hypothetical protein